MNVTDGSQTLVLPDFFVVGAARSGTSSLYFYLRDHPEIFMPEFKEPHFFSFLGKRSPHPNLPPWTVIDYTKLFSEAKNNQTIGESSASYLYYYEDSIKNIKEMYGPSCRDLKIIATLRNPVERAWSYYMLLKRNGYEFDFFELVQGFEKNGSEKDFNNFILSGKYFQQIKAYRECFPHIKIFLFEELSLHTPRVLKSIFEFLNLENRDYLPNNFDTVYNASGEPRNKLVRPLYNFLFQKNRFKNIAKLFIPYNVRQKIKTGISGKILKKKEIPSEVRTFLQNEFHDDLQSLLTVFDETGQKEIIQSWLSH